ncbi:hypothetical protein K2O51_31170 (plasmid) [Cupriavidus pinatubonensis]|uniref:hypothetical protein n=1 Tax=Cupriavidus pinatubonensis TaxID=248026 RepID=UPI001C72ED5D|nr:hypothetical protein [Cupriavidus pinatubonensis]QYY33708.1 hypothetical protein K2O51_31170 [Cupriavidus pinatubonensis]
MQTEQAQTHTQAASDLASGSTRAFHMAVSCENEHAERPDFATFRGDLWELRREVQRLQRACLDNGLFAASILYPRLHVEWHDPSSRFQVESARLVVDRYGDFRWEGRTRHAGNRVATIETSLLVLTQSAESGDQAIYQDSDVEEAVLDAEASRG